MNLQDICMKSLITQVSHCPPLIKELITQETKKEIKKNIYKETQNMISFIIPEIIKDMIKSITHNTIRKNYIKEYSDLNPDFVNMLVSTAKNIITSMDDYYITKAFEYTDFDDDY